MKLMVKIFYEQYSIASGAELNFNTVRIIPYAQAEATSSAIIVHVVIYRLPGNLQ